MSEYFEIAKSIQNVALSGVKSGEAIAEMKYKPIIKELLAATKYFRSLVDADLLDALIRNGNNHNQVISKAEGLL